MKITSTERNSKYKDRILVYVDNDYAFSVSEDDYLRLSLYEERDITQEEIAHIKNDVNFRSAKSAAVKFLSLKLRSSKEVSIKLNTDGFDEETIGKVIEELKSIGYINDKIYVQKYLYDRSKLKPKSKRLLKMELEAKGIPGQIIDEIMDDWEVDEFTIAEGLTRRKFGKYDINDERTVKRIYSFLHHRGFGIGLIEDVIKKLKEEQA